MQIKDDTVVTFDYTVLDENGDLVESSKDQGPMCYLHGAGRIIPGLEAALDGKKPRDTFSVTLPPEEAYGIRDDTRIHVFTRNELSGLGEIKIGMQLQAEDDSGKKILTISKIEDDEITLDENHPLAGKTISFDVTITDVRPATNEELGHPADHDVRCTDNCSACDLNAPSIGDTNCGCGCDHQ
ncbi:MAG: peptidylprolyl isomerase [Chloroflexi bacterium]|jgi:FKBP-type peptidyl-prolyl cis-trans isomerase SlyD|nr:peptidylprolyl isomerase [Chloroflexota bacterium]